MQTFVGDTVNLLLETGIDLSTMTTLRILYRKPNGTESFWIAAICPADSERILYKTSITDLDLNGIWEFQSYAANATEVLHGDFASLPVLEPIG